MCMGKGRWVWQCCRFSLFSLVLEAVRPFLHLLRQVCIKNKHGQFGTDAENHGKQRLPISLIIEVQQLRFPWLHLA